LPDTHYLKAIPTRHLKWGGNNCRRGGFQKGGKGGAFCSRFRLNLEKVRFPSSGKGAPIRVQGGGIFEKRIKKRNVFPEKKVKRGTKKVTEVFSDW